MKIKSILISQTEPKTDSSPYSELEKQNIKVDFSPFVSVEGLTAREVRNQKVDFAKFSAIIMTSKNSVDHFFRIAEEMRFHVPDAMKYLCQSEAVANYLQKYIVYRKRKVHIGEKSFSDLIPLFKKHKDLKYLFPTADGLNEDFTAILDKSEVEWARIILYKTTSSDLSFLKDFPYDILVFFSPASIQALFDNFPDFKQENTAIATFGKTTTEAAKNAGLTIQVEAPNAESPSMAMALSRYIKSVNAKK
jgi:uroporphyrinogen-III synthase